MSALPSTAGWQAGFLSVLPAVELHAQIQFRRLRAEQREEAIQEAIASACVSYQILASKGRLHDAHPGTLATFAVNFVRNGRHVGGKQDAAQDVMSSVGRRRHGVRLVHFDRQRGQGQTEGWKQLVVADRKHPVPDIAAFRIDFSQWLKTLMRRDRMIIGAMVAGEGTFAVADRFGLSAGRVSQLRRRYEREWRVFQGEVPRGVAAAA
jgi:hypothetical protein